MVRSRTALRNRWAGAPPVQMSGLGLPPSVNVPEFSGRRRIESDSPAPCRMVRFWAFPSPSPAGVDLHAGLCALVGRPLEEVERIFITETLRLTGGNREQAAELLGIGERTLYRKIKEYQLT